MTTEYQAVIEIADRSIGIAGGFEMSAGSQGPAVHFETPGAVQSFIVVPQANNDGELSLIIRAFRDGALVRATFGTYGDLISLALIPDPDRSTT